MKHSASSKAKISVARKKYLSNKKNNYWSSYQKETLPERKFKEIASHFKEKFTQYYKPFDNRGFEIDFAIVNKKIGFEINGNQHYKRDGTLKDYYIIRNHLLELDGWLIVQIPYFICFDEKIIKKIISSCINDEYVDNLCNDIINDKINRKKIKEKKLLNKISRAKELLRNDLSLEHKEIINIFFNEQECEILKSLKKIKKHPMRVVYEIIKKSELREKRLKDYYEIDKKWGYISKLAKKWNISHTQVRRYLAGLPRLELGT